MGASIHTRPSRRGASGVPAARAMQRMGLLLAALSLAACAEEADYLLRVELPDADAAALITELELWIVEPDGHGCAEVVAGRVEPDALPVRVHEVIAFPEQTAPRLRRVPVAELLFAAVARRDASAPLLRGCEKAVIEGRVSNEVVLRLAWLCARDPTAVEEPFNDADDDCDGLIDECVEDADCDDGNSCTIGTCRDGMCRLENRADGEGCDDADLCTEGDACEGGRCQGRAVDCRHLDAECERGACDPATGLCGAVSAEGETCDDLLFCTVRDRCVGGSCLGEARSCDDADACTLDTCSEDQGTCLYYSAGPQGPEGPPGHPSCSNGVDDDCDGEVDQDDDGCRP